MPETPTDYFPELLRALQAGQGGDALTLLDQAARAHPLDPRPLLLIAAEFVHAKRLDQAEAAYVIALQRAPTFAIARFQLGLLQLTSARPATAFATWAPLDLLDEKEPLRLFKRGLQAMAQDRFDEARQFLSEGIERNTVNPALSQDMQKILDKIATLGTDGKAAAPASAASAGGGQPDAGSQESGHVLISGYRPAT